MSTSDGSKPLDVQIGGDHYKSMAIQPMEYSMANKLDSFQHTIIKYVTRFRGKGGIQDLEKAKHCIDLLIHFERQVTALPTAFGQQNMIDPEDVEISEKQACSVSADEHADMLARFDKRRAELLLRGSCESNVTVLPDGSAFGVMSFPLSRGHWLYADRAYEDGADQPKELPAPILNHGSRDTVVAAARYAVRGATNCGKEPDFDPDALVQNVVYALCGPYGRVEPIPVEPADVDIASEIDDDSERMQAIGQNGNGGEHYETVGTPVWRDAPSWAQWLAQDSGGRWYWFEFPIYADSDDEEWYEQEGFNGGIEIAGESEERNENWSKTMQARPIK